MVISYFFSAQEQINITLSTSEAQKTGVIYYMQDQRAKFLEIFKKAFACYNESHTYASKICTNARMKE